MSLRSHALLAALAAASWCIVPAALSQEPPPSSTAEDPATAQDPAEQMPPAQQSATAPIEDKKIEQFADAYLAVQTIQQKAAADIQSASTPEEADKVKASAESDMIAAVERSGLQVPEFNRIVETMAADVNVRSRVAAELQKRSGGT